MLVGIYLGKNMIGDEGARALADFLVTSKNGIALHPVPCAPSLAQIHIFGNRLTPVGKVAMEAACKARGGAPQTTNGASTDGRPLVTIEFD